MSITSKNMITKKYTEAFQKKGLSRIYYLIANSFGLFSLVIKSGKVPELTSFLVWEVLVKMGVYRGKYLQFTDADPLVKIDNDSLLVKTATNVPAIEDLVGEGFKVSVLAPDWTLTFIDSQGVLWGVTWIDQFILRRSHDRGDAAEEVYSFPDPVTSIYVTNGNTVFVCAGGSVYRSGDDGASFQKVLEFATTNSYFRQNHTFTEDPDGNLLVGEYGLAVDEESFWRSVAWIYISQDDGESWTENDFFIREGANKHIHLVKYCANVGKLIVADGDNHKRLWVNNSYTDLQSRTSDHRQSGWRLINRRHIQMGGHTSILESGDAVLFGTDYLGGTNFLLETTDFVKFRAQVVPDPYRRSMFHNLFYLQAGSRQQMWAWLDNLSVRGPNVKGLLMYSSDNGQSWTKFLDYDHIEHWARMISTSNYPLDYLLIDVEETTYRVQLVADPTE